MPLSHRPDAKQIHEGQIMLRIEIIAAGKMKSGAQKNQWDEYTKRLSWPLTLHEIEGRNKDEECAKIEKKMNAQAFIIALDETGKSIGSRAFAEKLGALAAEGRPDIQLVIGGADGLTPEIRKKAHFLLSFGAQTWPHMLVRVMLAEQIYRAQQILSGHPYHRD